MAAPLFDATESRFIDLLESCPIVPGATVSKPLLNRPEGRVVVFAIDRDQEISEHRAPFVAIVQVLAGRLRFTVGAEEREMGPNDWLVMPPSEPHALAALEPTHFLLTLFKGT